jgi:hypothetical protein
LISGGLIPSYHHLPDEDPTGLTPISLPFATTFLNPRRFQITARIQF